MGVEAENHSIENQKIREEFEGLLRSFDRLIEENRKKKNRIEKLLVNKALLEKTIKDLEKELAEEIELKNQEKSKKEGLEKTNRQLEIEVGKIPSLDEKIKFVRRVLTVS